MSKNKFCIILMAFVAMSFFSPSYSLAQAEKKAFTPKIKTPDTSKELINDKSVSASTAEEEIPRERPASSYPAASAPRRLQQHGLGLGLGQTFLLGKYADYGDDKITLDLLYSYAASYSFDVLVNAHMSEHKHKNERMKTTGLTGSIKGRFVEYDNFSPFFLGGLGFYAPKARRDDQGNGRWTEQKVTFGLNFGGGVDLRLNDNYVVGVMGQMHCPFKVQQEDQSDLRGYYFKLLITGMYLF